MKHLLTFQSFPMVVVIALIAWSWFSILSVLVAKLF